MIHMAKADLMVETCLKRVETDFRTDFEMGTTN